jgi:hypothetical protein
MQTQHSCLAQMHIARNSFLKRVYGPAEDRRGEEMDSLDNLAVHSHCFEKKTFITYLCCMLVQKMGKESSKTG